MQEITYASKTFVTTDALADALLRLVTAINRQAHSEAVVVPAYTDAGRRVEAKMTLDASSELVVVPVELDAHTGDEDANDEAVAGALADIEDRINRMKRASAAFPTTDPTPPQFSDDF